MADQHSDAPRRLDRLKARLMRAAGAWLLMCLALAAALTWARVQDNRQDVLKQGSQRLQAFSDSVDTHSGHWRPSARRWPNSLRWPIFC